VHATDADDRDFQVHHRQGMRCAHADEKSCVHAYNHLHRVAYELEAHMRLYDLLLNKLYGKSNATDTVLYT
jgi:hypothetical protein